MRKNLIFIIFLVAFNILIFSNSVLAQDYVVFTRPAITNKMILDNTVPSPSEINDTMAIFASPSEYEPATFAIRAYNDLSNVQVSLKTDLIGDNGIIQKNNVDISLVKIWWQQDRGDVAHPNPNASKQLVPELLIKNDSLITIDYVNQINILNFNGLPTDSSSLQPVNIQSNTTRQFWITVYVPDGTQPGIYNGTIEISPQNSDIKDLVLSVNVLPIHLEKSILDYSMYYRSIINASCNLVPSPLKVWCRTPEQYEAELRDMLSHGVDRPTVYEEAQDKSTSIDTTYLTMVLEIRKKVGLGNTPLFTILNNLPFLGVWWIGAPSSALTKLTSYTGNLKSLAQSYGYTDLYVYAYDEASGSTLTQERPAFQAVHDGGGKVFTAVSAGFFSYIGDMLDLPIMSLKNFAELGQVHALGYKMYSYDDPQTGLEQPYMYRNNYGLWLWKQGLDGSCDYVYQDVSGNSGWNDFDEAHYKDQTMAYSSSNGVIDTVQWEGMREGYDDLRYLSTLLKQINESKKYPNSYSSAVDAENWLNNLGIAYRVTYLPDNAEENDLQGIRWQMAQRIISLKNAARAKVSGKLSDNNGSSLQGVITSFNSGTSIVNASAQTDASGNYNFYLFPDLYDLRYDISNFYLKLLSANITIDKNDLVSNVTKYSDNNISFIANFTGNLEYYSSDNVGKDVFSVYSNGSKVLNYYKGSVTVLVPGWGLTYNNNIVRLTIPG